MRLLLPASLRGFWRQRRPRERVLLALAGALVFVFGATRAWEAFAVFDRAQSEQLLRRRGQWAGLQALEREAAELRARPVLAPLAAAQLPALWRQGAAEVGLAIDRVTATVEGAHALRVRGRVVFDDWIRCAALLAERHRLKLESLHAEPADEPGRVTLDAVFVDGAAAP